MVMLTDLAVAVAKSGLRVVEVPGWQNRGHGHMYSVESIVCHHTATNANAAGNYPSLAVVRDGRSDLPGPLAQLGLARDGSVYVIAAGVCYHAGATLLTRQDNWHAIGIEAEHDGISPWPPALVDAYVRLVAALRAHYGVPLTHVEGHKEVCDPPGRKSDPNFDMDAFRARVLTATTNLQEDDMPKYTDWDQADRDALARDVAKAVSATDIGDERIANPLEDDGPGSRSLAVMLWTILKLLRKIAKKVGA